MSKIIRSSFAYGMAFAALAVAEKSGAASGGAPKSTATPPIPAGSTPVAAAPKTAKAPVVITPIRADLTMPTKTSNRGSKSKYDFDGLQVGQSIGVIGRDAASLQSTVSSQNRNKKYQMAKRDSSTGAPLFNKMKTRGADGVETEVDNPNSPVMESTRHFFVVDVDPASDPDKATARIWRDK